MAVFQKISPENISYEEIVRVWEQCNKERIALQTENTYLTGRIKQYEYEIGTLRSINNTYNLEAIERARKNYELISKT